MLFLEIILDLHAVVRNNAKRAHVYFVQFPLMANIFQSYGTLVQRKFWHWYSQDKKQAHNFLF